MPKPAPEPCAICGKESVGSEPNPFSQYGYSPMCDDHISNYERPKGDPKRQPDRDQRRREESNGRNLSGEQFFGWGRV